MGDFSLAQRVRNSRPYKRVAIFLKPHGMTFAQFCVILVTSNLPVLSLALIKTVVAAPGEVGFWSAVITQLKGGDVYVYSAAMVAPFWWTLFEYQRSKDRIKAVGVPFALSLICTLASALIYGASQVTPLRNIPLVNVLAVGIYLSSALVLYWSVYYDRQKVPDVSKGHEREELAVKDILTDLKGATQ